MSVSPEHVRRLHKYERQILTALERWMHRYAWVPLDQIRMATMLSESEMNYRLSRLIGWDMVRYNAVPYEGYALVFGGYDALALLSLTKKGVISALGARIGEGKESVVIEALGLGPVAIKFHRVGQRSFKSSRINREYMPTEGHCPSIFASQRSAEREYLALTLVHQSVSVPLPIARNRHAVVMSLVAGTELHRTRVEDPAAALDEILKNVREAYRAGVIHADLSEYNVMVEEDRCVIIDWPQWVETAHPNADEILLRDVRNILSYFHKKYRLKRDEGEAIRCVTG